MARMIPVLIVLVVLAGGLSASLVPFIDCPECPNESPCLRCRQRRKLTALEYRRRDPLDPTLIAWLKSTGMTASYAGDLAQKHGRPRSDMVGWRESRELFFYSNAAQVEGPDGPLVLGILLPKVVGPDDGSPVRVLLFDRRGRELDRLDALMPGAFGLDGELELIGEPSVVLTVTSAKKYQGDEILLVSTAGKTVLPRKQWPLTSSQRGVVRIVQIVVRNGRLAVVAP